MTGCVYLVGAGCGDAGLITVRGRELLQNCDAVVYDELIDLSLLREAAGAERYPMGKRGGRKAPSQREINDLLLSLARMGKRVVRLKGGDPFVFGRGGEEAQALQAAGVPFEVVPGISSAIAIPALAGIPVTHRGVSQSVHIITAASADAPDGLNRYIEQYAALPGTLVFLMGLGKLEEIAIRLMAGGMAADMPAAVISGGCAPRQTEVRGTVGDIAVRTRMAEVQPPAVIVVGQAAALKLQNAACKKPESIQVGLIGTSRMTDRLVPLLEAKGLSAVPVLPMLVRPLHTDFDFGKLTRPGRRWIVLTSGNGTELFFQRLGEAHVDLRLLAACRFAVIGASTGEALARHGIWPDVCPAHYTSEALAYALLEEAEPGEAVYLFRSDKGNPKLPEMLKETHPVWNVPLYTVMPDEAAGRAAKSKEQACDCLAFASAEGVRGYFAVHGAVPEGTVCVCIGETTAKALAAYYDGPVVTAAHTSAEGIAEVLGLVQKAQSAVGAED